MDTNGARALRLAQSAELYFPFHTGTISVRVSVPLSSLLALLPPSLLYPSHSLSSHRSLTRLAILLPSSPLFLLPLPLTGAPFTLREYHSVRRPNEISLFSTDFFYTRCRTPPFTRAHNEASTAKPFSIGEFDGSVSSGSAR